MDIISQGEDVKLWDKEVQMRGWLDSQPLGTIVAIHQKRGTMWSKNDLTCDLEVTQTNPTRWSHWAGAHVELPSSRIVDYITDLIYKDNFVSVDISNSGRTEEKEYGQPDNSGLKYEKSPTKHRSAYHREEANVLSRGNKHQIETFYNTHGRR
jgi:hypothetical protein